LRPRAFHWRPACLLLKIAAFFLLNTLLPTAVLYVVQRSADCIWIGIVHYLMDVAIDAFD